MQRRRAAVSGVPGPAGREEVQARVLGCMAPLLCTARLLGLAPFRLLRPTAKREARVVPCPFWSVYSALVVVAVMLLAIVTDYHVVVERNDRRNQMVVTLTALKPLLLLVFFLKHGVTVFIMTCCIFKAGDVAGALEGLVRFPGRLTGGLDGDLGARWMSRARWVTALQAGGMVVLGVTNISLRARPLEYFRISAEMSTLPAVYLLNMLFIDAALLLRRELETLNEALEAQFASRQAWDLPSDLPFFVASEDTASATSRALFLASAARGKSGGGRRLAVGAARAAHRALRRIFLQLDDAFALQNLFFVMLIFVHTTVILYTFMVESIFIWHTIVTTIVFLVQLLATLTACQCTTDESGRTAVLVHRALLRDDLGEATRAELVDFSAQLLSAEMRFSAWGFFAMDYALLQSFVGTVVTYIVIMVQFQSPRSPAAANATATTAAPPLSSPSTSTS